MVMPVYNGARYLAGALDSIFAQSFTDFELIVVDDCSSDATPQILADYASRHANMRVITNAQNKKLPASLNIGFAQAQGELLSWTSDDNELAPNMLERLYSASRTSDADIYYANFNIIDEDGKPRGKGRADPARELVFGNAIGCCFLYRREVDAALGGYDENLFGVEDYDFWLRAYEKSFRFEPINEELYSYRRHAGSLTDKRARQIHAMTAPIMRRVIDQLPPSPFRAEAYMRLLTRDPYTPRLPLAWRAFRDHPPALLQHTKEIFGWLKYSVRVRLRRA